MNIVGISRTTGCITLDCTPSEWPFPSNSSFVEMREPVDSKEHAYQFPELVDLKEHMYHMPEYISATSFERHAEGMG